MRVCRIRCPLVVNIFLHCGHICCCRRRPWPCSEGLQRAWAMDAGTKIWRRAPKIKTTVAFSYVALLLVGGVPHFLQNPDASHKFEPCSYRIMINREFLE